MFRTYIRHLHQMLFIPRIYILEYLPSIEAHDHGGLSEVHNHDAGFSEIEELAHWEFLYTGMHLWPSANDVIQTLTRLSRHAIVLSLPSSRMKSLVVVVKMSTVADMIHDFMGGCDRNPLLNFECDKANG